MSTKHSHYSGRKTNIPIEITGMEYFGPEQCIEDIETIVKNTNDPTHIVGRFDGLWDGELDDAIKTATKVVYADHYELEDYLYEVTNFANYPTLRKMPEKMGFVKGKNYAQIQMQRPGCVMTKHFDPESIFDPWSDERDKCVRVLVALAPWEYGQLIGFNNRVLTEWNKGEIIYCDFPKTWHYTANCSWHSRPLLQVSGVASDALLRSIQNKEYNIFKV